MAEPESQYKERALPLLSDTRFFLILPPLFPGSKRGLPHHTPVPLRMTSAGQHLVMLLGKQVLSLLIQIDWENTCRSPGSLYGKVCWGKEVIVYVDFSFRTTKVRLAVDMREWGQNNNKTPLIWDHSNCLIIYFIMFWRCWGFQPPVTHRTSNSVSLLLWAWPTEACHQLNGFHVDSRSFGLDNGVTWQTEAGKSPAIRINVRIKKPLVWW